MSNLPANVRVLTPNRSGLSPAEQFLLETIFLQKPVLAAKSAQIALRMCDEPDVARRADLSRQLITIDAIGELKFPGEWESARRTAA